MFIEKTKIAEFNGLHAADHKRKFDFIASEIKDVEEVLQKLIDFQVAIPSWHWAQVVQDSDVLQEQVSRAV